MPNHRPYQHSDRKNPRGPQGPTPPNVTDEELQQIIKNGDGVRLNEVAYKLGEYYAAGSEKEKLSSSQIRGILDHLQRMYHFDGNELQLLRPKLAYAAGRHGGKVKDLRLITDRAIQLVGNNNQYFKNFRNFFEAIVAYHRYHGGK